MKLTLQDVQEDREAFLQAGIGLPAYDAATVQQIGRETPVWAHFGIGNIFRIFIGSIVDRLERFRPWCQRRAPSTRRSWTGSTALTII